MAALSKSFSCLLIEDKVHETLFSMLAKEDIASVRATCTACCNLLTQRLFKRTQVTFTTNTFTRPARVQALAHIGHHIEHLTFNFPHGDSTFLPPLIHPQSGREMAFLYTPHTSMGSVLVRPKYANSELGDILTAQYPPLFHAATNVPSFINAMMHMPNIRHLTIKTPGQDPRERYRRSVVDYALISLRVSLERAPLHRLTKLSLSAVHPSAFLYLRPLFSLGSRPSAGKRWRQIKKLHVSVKSWDFYGPSPGLDHLMIMDDFIRTFQPTLEKITVTWLGRKGPCPLALQGDPLFGPPKPTKKLFKEVTLPMSPLPPAPQRTQMVFPRLRFMQVCNATINAPQIATLVSTHRDTVREFDFENVALTLGTWDDALAPLMDKSADRTSTGEYRSLTSRSEVWMRSHNNLVAGSFSGTMINSVSEEQLPLPSAAAEAASRELFNKELARGVLGLTLVHDQDKREQGVLERATQTPKPMVAGSLAPASPPAPADDDEGLYDSTTVTKPDDNEREREKCARHNILSQPIEVPQTPPPRTPQPVEEFTHPRAKWPEEGLANKIITTLGASESVSANIKKQKIKKRHRKRKDVGQESQDETEKPCRSSSQHQKHKHKHKHKHHHDYNSSSSPSSSASSGSCSPWSRTTSEKRGCKKDSPAHPHTRLHKRCFSSPSHNSHTLPVTGIPKDLAVPEVLTDAHVATTASPEPTIHSPLPLLVRSNTSSSNSSNKSGRSFRLFRSLKSLRSRPSISDKGSSVYNDDMPSTPQMEISAPVLAPQKEKEQPAIMLLEPTVYDPSAVVGSNGDLGRRGSIHEITAVQRDIEAEAKHRMLAEDDGFRASALRKAKERVMMKLSREFSSRSTGHHDGQDRKAENATGLVRRMLMDYYQGGNDWSGTELQRGCQVSPSPMMRNWCGGNSALSTAASEPRSIDSQSALVPLIISR